MGVYVPPAKPYPEAIVAVYMCSFAGPAVELPRCEVGLARLGGLDKRVERRVDWCVGRGVQTAEWTMASGISR